MKSNELRIGNLVHDPLTGEWLRVIELTEYNIVTSVINRDKFPLPDGWSTAPILVTVAMLSALDFKYNVSKEYFYRELKDKPQGIETLNVGSGVHLHQLQNLYYALTNEDLDVSSLLIRVTLAPPEKLTGEINVDEYLKL